MIYIILLKYIMVQKKCPPGVFCIENMTLTILIGILALVLIYLFYVYNQTNINEKKYINDKIRSLELLKKDNYNKNVVNKHHRNHYNIKPTSLYSNVSSNAFYNPHAPPLIENPFLFGGGIESGIYKYHTGSSDPRELGLPINIPTSHMNTQYKQVGILTRKQGKDTILALFGRPVHSNRNKWQYYTMTDKNNMIKLPISRNGRSCTGEYGCDEVYNGDSVYVEGYQDAFDTTIYENGSMQYIPY